MTHTVQTTIHLAGDSDVGHVCAFAAVNVRCGEPISTDEPTGFIELGSARPIKLNGTAADMRRFAKAVEDGAMEMERLDAEARIAVDLADTKAVTV